MTPLAQLFAACSLAARSSGHGDEILRAYGNNDPGAFASTATSMATDPLMLLGALGPALRLARGVGGAAEGLGAARASTPFLKSAAFGFETLAGSAILDANRDANNPMADALATGLMAAPLRNPLTRA